MSKENIQDIEKQVKDLMEASIKSYTDNLDILTKEKEACYSEREKLPSKFIASEMDNYDDHTLHAANLKHRAIKLSEKSLAIYESLEADCEFFSAQLQLYVSEFFLKEHGFDRITDKLRESYVNTNKNMNDLNKLKAKLKSLSSAADKLFRAFESDETNCRKIADRNGKMKGF